MTATLAVLSAAPVHAQAYQCRLPGSVEAVPPPHPDGPSRQGPGDWYVLAASWSPEYCHFARDRDSMQCSGRQGRFGFVLHGLWPDALRGPPPQWCRPAPVPSPDVLRRNLCMTPDAALLGHEWAKHGSCMTDNAETYYKVSGILWRSVQWPDADRLSRKKDLVTGDLRDAFVLANPGWRRDQIGVETSASGWLRAIRLCYSRRFLPMRCPAGRLGAVDSAPLKIWRGL